MDNHQITSGLKKKDQKAFEAVIDKYTPLVAGIIRNVSKGSLAREDIEETVADVFVALWNNTDNIIEDKLKGYICCIAKTKTLNKIESVKKHIVLNIDDYDPEDDFSISSELEKRELAKQLRDIISELNVTDKEIIIRYYYYSQNIVQIAGVMNMNSDTVKSKLRRTREKIKIKLIERGITYENNI